MISKSCELRERPGQGLKPILQIWLTNLVTRRLDQGQAKAEDKAKAAEADLNGKKKMSPGIAEGDQPAPPAPNVLATGITRELQEAAMKAAAAMDTLRTTATVAAMVTAAATVATVAMVMVKGKAE